jgi:hypothetical protein
MMDDDKESPLNPQTVAKCVALLEKADVCFVWELSRMSEEQLSKTFAGATPGMDLYFKKLLERARAE